MVDLIMLVELSELGSCGTVIEKEEGKEGQYSLTYVRLSSSEDRDRLLSGTMLPQLPKGSVIEHGEIYAPLGAAPDALALGYPAPGSLQQAIELAKAALQNRESEIRQKGFLPDTPVYVMKRGRRPERL